MKDDEDDRRSPAEKVVGGSLVDQTGVGKPLAERTLQRQRTVESYLRGEAVPRYMQRAAEIERGEREHLRRLAAIRARLQAELPVERAAAAFLDRVRDWDFSALNALIEQHNSWYPIERDLPMDPRTGDYVLVHGRSYKRERRGPDWALAELA